MNAVAHINFTDDSSYLFKNFSSGNTTQIAKKFNKEGSFSVIVKVIGKTTHSNSVSITVKSKKGFFSWIFIYF